MSDEHKTYKIHLNDGAKLMLLEHVRFLSEISESAAQKLRDKLYDGCTSLCIMPHRCPKFHTYRVDDIYRKLIIGRYQLVFSVDDEKNTVNIKYILDSRQSNDI